MKETCFCGGDGEVADRGPILDADSPWALRCPDCGHVDYLLWLPEEAGFLLWGEAKQRSGMRHISLSHHGQAA